MSVTLYTSRIVLNALGVIDYGIYSVVGGIVVLFSFFNSAMTSATQRFLAFDIGKNDQIQLKKTFNATLNIHICIAVLIFLLAETIGLWFVNNKLNLPLDRMVAVNWVYQFSVFTFLLGIIQVPYDGLIIARERMSIYAYMSIAEVFLKLIIVYVLVVFDFDKLKLYAVLLFLVAFIVRTVHKIYCKRNYKECKYEFYFDKSFYKVLLSYSGWSLFGNIAGIARGQGSNILLNIFFGTMLNASYGIAMQVQAAVHVFVYNFQMAVNPQIIKQYSAGNKEQSLNLIFQSAKFSYFLMFIIACPVIYNIDFILELWLKKPPKFTSIFVVLCLINVLIDCISGPLMVGAQATGKIKWYQIIIGSFIFLNLPISYFLLKIYKLPFLIFHVSIVITIVSLFFRLFFLRKLIGLSISNFFKFVLRAILLVSTLSFFIIYLFHQEFIIESNLFGFLINSTAILLINIILIYYLGTTEKEKHFLKKMIINKLRK